MFVGALLLVLVAGVASDPLFYASPYAYSPYRSAALLSSPLVAPASAAVVAPAAAPAVYSPYSAYSAYSYGSSYSVQDYLAAAPAAAAAYTYGVPLPYAAEWYYRR